MPFPYFLSEPQRMIHGVKHDPYKPPGRGNVPGAYLSYAAQEQEPFPEELEPYLGAEAINARLAQARRDSRASAFLQAGGAMLSAPDLMSGLGGAAQAFAGPMDEQRRMERELPAQAALERYGIQRDAEQNARARNAEGRAQGTWEMDREQAGYEASMRPMGEEQARLGLEHDNLRNEAMRLALKYGDVEAVQRLQQGAATLDATREATKSEVAFRQPKIENVEANTSESLDRGAYYRAGGSGGFGTRGGLTDNSILTDLRMSQKEAQDRLTDYEYTLGLPVDNDTIAGMALALQTTKARGLGAGMIGKFPPDSEVGKALQIEQDLMRNPQLAAQKWAADPVFQAIWKYKQFERARARRLQQRQLELDLE